MENLKANQTKSTPDKNSKEISSSQKSRRDIPVTFFVTVPDNAGGPPSGVYLAGSFNQFSPNLPDWDPRGLAMKKLSENRWSITLMGQPGIEVEYKYTLGSWQRVEADDLGQDRPNRHIVLNAGAGENQSIEDMVLSWRNG